MLTLRSNIQLQEAYLLGCERERMGWALMFANVRCTDLLITADYLSYDVAKVTRLAIEERIRQLEIIYLGAGYLEKFNFLAGKAVTTIRITMRNPWENYEYYVRSN